MPNSFRPIAFALTFLFASSASLPASAAKNAATLSAKAKSAFAQNKFEKASSLFEKARELDANNPDIPLWLGRSYDALTAFDLALKEYATALKLKHPEPHVVHNDIGVTHAKMKKYAAAATAFQKAVGLQPKFALGHYNLGKAYYALGKKAAARALFDKLKAMGEIDMAQSLWEQIYK